MPNHLKNNTPKTTIWKTGADGLTLVKTIPGLPYGCPRMNMVIDIPGLGRAYRSGCTKSGTGPNETVQEVKFTLQ